MDINLKIEEIRLRVKEITKHFPYTEFEINFLTICYIAIASIDNDITDLLDEVFSRVFILFNNSQFNKMIKKAEKKGILEYGGMHIKREEEQCEFIIVNAFHLPNDTYYMTRLFDIVIHEIKHAMNCQIKTHVIKGETEYIYSGLNGRPHGAYVLDEAFNCFITRVYLKQVVYLKEKAKVKNPEIKQILNAFNSNIYMIPYSYNATYLLAHLFNNKKFFKLLYNAALFRDLETLYAELAKIMEFKDSNIEWFFIEYLGEYDMYGDINEYLREKLDMINKKCPRRVLEIRPHFKNI